MRNLLAVLFIAAAVLCPLTAWAIVPVTQMEDPKLAAVFENADAVGTFVLYDRWENKLTFHNQERGKQRFIPASTFKIPNTLIGLETGTVADVDEIFKWNGEPQYLKSWEKDMGLREAIKVSNVAVYQQLARRIGYERMQSAVIDFGYGNKNIGDADRVDIFWLEGPLEISALEQAVFLTRLAMGELPAAQANIDTVKEITLFKESAGKTLHAKTGTSGRVYDPPLGWWVGWVEEKATGRVWSFALNIDMPDYPEGPDRIALGLECLQTLGIWPAD